jgi:hypothetical protein
VSSDQFDPAQVVRIRMKVRDADKPVWSPKMARRLAEIDVALGAEHLAIEHADGRRVLSACIAPWTFN